MYLIYIYLSCGCHVEFIEQSFLEEKRRHRPQ